MYLLDLFSGVGGMSLGLERSGLCITRAFCEIEPYQRLVLNKNWPNVHVYKDINTLPYIDGVDVIAGGFPCQPFSTAARGRNIPEKDLWGEMLRVVERQLPKIVIGENVSEKAIRRSQRDLCNLGYGVAVKRISGADCGAPHRRNRWWVIAHPYNESKFLSALNAETSKLPEICSGLWTAETYARAIRVPDGVPNRLDRRLTCMGNAVIPAIPEAIGRAVLEMSLKQVYATSS